MIVGTLISWFIGGTEYAEQVLYRKSMCEPCFKIGSCTSCGCNMPDTALVPSNECSAGKWGPMFNKKQWEEFKEIYKIEGKLK
jgi:hypothetical protein